MVTTLMHAKRVSVLLSGGWSADRCVSREASRAAATSWWTAATLSGRLDSCLYSTEPYSKKVLCLQS